MAEENLLPFVQILQNSPNYLPELKPYEPDRALGLTPEFQRHACKDCKRLIIKLLKHAAGPSQDTYYRNIERHLDSVLSTLANNSTNCRICAIIMNQIKCDRAHVEHEFTYYRLFSSLKRNSFCVLLTRDIEAKSMPSDIDGEPSDIYGEFSLYRSDLPKRFSWLDYGVVYTSPMEELSVSRQPYLVSRDFPWHGKAIEKIKAWMEDCERHDHCPAPHSAALPKRVLKIVDNSVFLHISGEEDAAKNDHRYVALSYRWGNDLPLKLTRDTMDTFVRGHSIKELPATLRDAVHISRKLGFEFIWIDALCIIQDDKQDWAEQSAKMADIYRQSSLNLCAADSAGCRSGMVEMAAPHVVEIATARAQRSAGSTKTVVLMGGPFSDAIIDVSGCGLQSRGWVFQEHLCSPRSLYVSRRHGLWWECRTMIDVIDESEPVETGDTDHAFNPRTKKRSFPTEEHVTDFAIEDFSFSWYDWIELYTSTDLTRQMDRLPAVAGLAAYVASLSNMHYRAGLWEEDIRRGLTWRKSQSDYAERIPGGAPTWSWASITGPIRYDEFFTMCVDHRGMIRSRAELDLDITEMTIEEESPGNFGNVLRGQIRVSGILRPAATMLLELRLDTEWELDLQPAEQEADFLQRCQVLRLAVFYRRKQGTRAFSYYLIVRATGRREHEYQRVGLGRIALKAAEHPNNRHFSRRGRREPSPGPLERDMWKGAEKVALSLV